MGLKRKIDTENNKIKDKQNAEAKIKSEQMNIERQANKEKRNKDKQNKQALKKLVLKRKDIEAKIKSNIDVHEEFIDIDLNNLNMDELLNLENRVDLSIAKSIKKLEEKALLEKENKPEPTLNPTTFNINNNSTGTQAQTNDKQFILFRFFGWFFNVFRGTFNYLTNSLRKNLVRFFGFIISSAFLITFIFCLLEYLETGGVTTQGVMHYWSLVPNFFKENIVPILKDLVKGLVESVLPKLADLVVKGITSLIELIANLFK